MKNFFYFKDKKHVTPVLDVEKNKQAKKKLAHILKTKKELIPENFIERWSEVACITRVAMLKKPTPS